MIPKHIERKGRRNTYRALTLYLVEAEVGQEAGAKTRHYWSAGGQSDDFWADLAEVEATQTLNTRSRANKTYHLMVSFRPEDEIKLTAGVLKEIEIRLAEALGFTGHQRHCGYHVNTAHPHLHIAYNAIHPRTFRRHSPYGDYQKLTRACRAIEAEFGLAVDKGRADRQPGEKAGNNLIQAVEARTGQESFFRYLQNQKAALMAEMEAAATWAEAHGVLAKRGLVLKPKGQGLVIQDRFGQPTAKASSLDRSLSRARLEARFGFFQAPDRILESATADTTYTSAPRQPGSETDKLWADFQAELSQRWAALKTLDQDNQRLYEKHLADWAGKRQELKRLPLLKPDRQKIGLEFERRKREAIKRLRAEALTRRKEIRTARPFTTWKAYLKYRAAQNLNLSPAVSDSPNQEPPTIKTPPQGLKR
jgi:hypothetical protein